MSQDIILGLNERRFLGRRGGAEVIVLKERKRTDQQDAKEACGLKDASSGDLIDFLSVRTIHLPLNHIIA